VLEDRVQLPRGDMRWITPAAYQDGDAALITLGRILGSGKNSRLYRRLVYELQIADDVSAYQGGRKLNGEFEISVTARAGRDLDELERVIMEEVSRIQREPPEPRELERALNQYEVAFLEQLERVDAKADVLNEYLFYTGRPDYFNEDLGRFRALKPADISEAARRWLAADARVILSIVPEGKPELAVEGSVAVPNRDLELSPAQRKPAS
jgi:zinc protease